MSKPLLKEQATLLRTQQRMSLKEICKQLSISQSTASVWLRDFSLSDEELSAKRRSNSKSLLPKIKKKVVVAHSTPVNNTITGKVSTAMKGKAAEAVFLARCLMVGIHPFVSFCEDNKIDVVVGKCLKRIQVKTINDGGFRSVRVHQISHHGTSKYKYTSDDIDYFVAVDLINFDVYVIPLEEYSKYNSAISLSSLQKITNKNDLSKLLLP